MADQKISALANGAPVLATDQFVVARGAGNDKILPDDVRKFCVPGGVANPNGTVTGVGGQLYIQESLGHVALWINTSSGTAWSCIYGAGAFDPNGLITGTRGAIWVEVPGDGTAEIWLNTTGAQVWI